MNARTSLIGVACFFTLLVPFEGKAQQNWAPDTNGVFSACVGSRRGRMRLVTVAQTCGPREFRVMWSMQGPPGDIGPAGADGQDGQDGQDGMQGPVGPRGPTGPAGSGGSAGPGEEVTVDMVVVPARWFFRGCSVEDSTCNPEELPAKQVYLDTFEIDRTEVTVVAYSGCVAAGVCGVPNTGNACNWSAGGRANHPINCVDWFHAEAYCAWAGKRLPTEAEWEKAARGSDGRLYPWGNSPVPSCTHVVMTDVNGNDGCGLNITWPVGKKTIGASPYGALDMAGNVQEWTADWYDANYYTSAPDRNPPGPATGQFRVPRGGSYRHFPFANVRPTLRGGTSPTGWSDILGFRCAK